MKKLSSPLLRKSLWLFLALFLMLASFASAAELTPEELAAMPAVSITYYTVQDGEALTLDATPTIGPLGKSYWVMVPQEAFSFPITLTITAAETTPGYTFSPMTGDTLEVDINTVDFDGAYTLITAYENEEMVDSFWLYVSTAEMPLEVEPAEVPVYYVDAEDNTNVLHYEVVLAYYNETNTITADTSLVPANYTLTGDSTATVTVDETSAASPEWVTFYFQAQVMQGTVNIYYTDEYGTPLASSQSQTLDPGTHYITPAPTDLQAGYVLTPESPTQVEVIVSSLGVATPSTVSFIYEQEAQNGFLTINYTDENSVPLVGAETLELTPGQHTITPNTMLIPSGYVLSSMSPTQFDVTVNNDGTITPTSSVSFIYAVEQVTPVIGYLPVFYTDANNNQLIPSETRTLEQGTHTITPNDAGIPSDYTLTSPAQVDVIIDATGTAIPASVTFIYTQQTATPTTVPEATPTPALTAVESYAATNDTGVRLRSEPSTASTDTILFQVEQGTQVWVYGVLTVDGTEWASINYSDTDCYVMYSLLDLITPTTEPTTAPVNGTLTVHYVDTNSVSIADDQVLSLPANTYSVSPDAAHVPSGYVLADGTPSAFPVTVYETGVTDPSEITFTYTQESATPTDTPTASPVPDSPADTYADYTAVEASATTNATGVRLRSEPSTASSDSILFQVNQGTAVYVYGTFTANGYEWAYINYSDTDCYVVYSFVTLDAVATPTEAAPTETPTEAPTATPTATVFDPTASAGYAAIGQAAVTNASSVNLRYTTVSGVSDNVVVQVSTGTGVWVYGTFPVDDTVWAYIRYNDIDCYVWYSLLSLVEPTDAPPVTGDVTVRYTDIYDAPLIDPVTVTLPQGTDTISVNASLIPDGYQLDASSPSQFDILVDETGTASPSVISFVLSEIPATPTDAPTDTPVGDDPADISATYPDYTAIGASAVTNINSVNVRYTPVSGSSDNVVSQVPLGTEVWVHGSFTSGDTQWAYIRYSETDCYVWLSLLDVEESVATPSPEITDELTDAPPVTGDVTVRYTNTDDVLLIDAITITLPQGADTIAADASLIPEGYQLDTSSPTQFDILVDETGTASPSVISFVLSEIPATPTDTPTDAPPVTGDVTVRYTDIDDAPLIDPFTVTLPQGTDTIAVNASLIPEGYQLDASSPSQFDILVDETGTASPSVISFILSEIPATPTETPANMPGEDDPPLDISGTYSGYTAIGKPGATNNTAVRLRSAPDSSDDSNIMFQVSQGSEVWVHGSFNYNDRNWAYIRYATMDCYVWLSLLDIDESFVTPSPSPAPTASPTQEPTTEPTDAPTTEPTDEPTDEPTTEPTDEPTEEPTASPTETVVQENLYVGYAVTTTQVALRDNVNFDDSSIIATLPADTLLYLIGQTTANGTVWTSAQTRLGEDVMGLMPYASVRTITPGEAQVYIDAYEEANAPTPSPSPSPTPTPAQQSGYFLTLGDDVPLRTVPGSQASISAWIAEDQAVYVSGQVYYDGYGWHVSNYNGISGYIREDQLRAMTSSEVSTYLAQATPTATPEATAAPYDPNALSSYGYVSANSVNFRQTPGGERIGVLNQYAFGLVLGSQTVSGVTWYNINQNGTEGWVHGSYFKVLTITELSSFLNSSEYLEGIINSGSSSTTTNNNSSGSATQGAVSAVEDWNVGVWENPSSSLSASYEPFNPYATPVAAVATATITPEPTATFAIGTMIPIAYEEETKETQTGGSWLGLVLGGIVLIGGAGGVYAYALTQNKKRKASARAAAARRAQQQNAQNNPYARRAAAAPPTASGQQQNQNPYQRPNPYARPQQTGQGQQSTPNPYAQRPQSRNPYARPQTPDSSDTNGSGSQSSHTARRSDRYRGDNDDNA